MKNPSIKRRCILAISASALLFANAPLQATEADEKIENAANASYVFKTYLKGDSVKVEADNGEVTLTGTVTDESHKFLAENTVAAMPGVKRVLNQLKVTDAPAEHSDTWLFLKVKNTLAVHRSVSASKTKVVLASGVVTLTGEAKSQAAKDLATEYAKDVQGVKEVKNEMTVAAAPAAPEQTIVEIIDDASITAQVRMTLLSHRSTFNLKATIVTADNIVAIGGKANTTAEKDLVTKLVSDVNGVKSVVNNMFVGEAAK